MEQATETGPQTGLSYLFTVLYLDRTTFQQNPHDVSAVDPQKSAFTDATHFIVNGKFLLDDEGKPRPRHDIYRFILLSQDDTDRSYMVDLLTGHFEINAIPFSIHDTEVQYFNRRLIFARRHYHNITMGSDGSKKGANERIVYRLGWQANLKNGSNVQHVMEFD